MTPTKKLEVLYARIPKISCKGLCADNCTVILMTPLERRRLQTSGRVAPNALEVLKMAKPVCPLLCPATRACTAYELRPLICRLYGVVARLRCPYGCKPERWLSQSEQDDILREIEEIGGPVQ